MKSSPTLDVETTSADGYIRERWLPTLFILIIGMFMSLLDANVVNVAIPAIQKEFGVPTRDLEWIVTAYTLSLGVVVPASSWLGDKFGLTRVYLASLVAFCLCSALCGISPNLPVMVAFRILQAIPGGVLPVVTLTMIRRIVPNKSFGAAMGVYGMGVIFAPAVGPTLGGYLVEYHNWRLIFFINVPIGIIGAIFAFLALPKIPPSRIGRFDFLGFFMISTTLFSILLALSEGQDWGWRSYPILILLFLAADTLALFVIIELSVEHPLLDLVIFRYRQFSISLILVLIGYLTFFAVSFYLPQFLEQGQGISPLNAGLTLLPEAIAMASLMPLSGQVYDKIGARLPAVVGLSTVAIGAYLLAGLQATTTQPVIIVCTWLIGIGSGISLMSVMAGGIAALPPEHVSHGSVANNVMQRVGVALGLPVLTSIATASRLQDMMDRSSLLGGHDRPHMKLVTRQGTGGLYALYRRVELGATAVSFGNVFLILAVMASVGAVLGITLKKPVSVVESKTLAPAEI